MVICPQGRALAPLFAAQGTFSTRSEDGEGEAPRKVHDPETDPLGFLPGREASQRLESGEHEHYMRMQTSNREKELFQRAAVEAEQQVKGLEIEITNMELCKGSSGTLSG